MKARNAATGIVLGTVWGLFALQHINHWRLTGKPTGLVLACQETLLVVLFLTRRKASTVSSRPADWVAGACGTIAPLLLRPSGWSIPLTATVGVWIQVIGAVTTVMVTFVLGRSFGVVAANRGVRTEGPYRVVRHPIYGSYLIGQLGYLLAALSLANLCVVAIGLLCQVWRISAEERVLSADATYVSYMDRVRYRLVPLLY